MGAPNKIHLYSNHRPGNRPLISWQNPEVLHPSNWDEKSQVRGWTNPFEKYANVTLDHFPRKKGWRVKVFELPPPYFHRNATFQEANLEAIHFSEIFVPYFSCAYVVSIFNHQANTEYSGWKSASSPLHVLRRPLPRWHPETLHEPANRVDIATFLLGCGLPLPWCNRGKWWFSVRNPKNKNPGCHWNPGRGGSHTQLVENLQMFHFLVIQENGQFYHLTYSIISAPIRNLADSFMSNTVSLVHLLNC